MPFPKGHKKVENSGMKEGQKTQKTLDKEEAKRIFREEQSKVWRETIKDLPKVYVADRMMGKEPDEMKIDGKIEISQIPNELLDEAEKKLEEKLKNE